MEKSILRYGKDYLHIIWIKLVYFDVKYVVVRLYDYWMEVKMTKVQFLCTEFGHITGKYAHENECF